MLAHASNLGAVRRPAPERPRDTGADVRASGGAPARHGSALGARSRAACANPTSTIADSVSYWIRGVVPGGEIVILDPPGGVIVSEPALVESLGPVTLVNPALLRSVLS